MEPTAGQTLLHYRLVAPIGQGGMGVVWRAHDTSLGRDVALKFLPDLLTGDPERMARLEREARLLASLNHPHIASIYGFHQHDGARFLAMELVEGDDLSARIAQGPIPVATAVPIALQIAEALEHAHEKGVIHRDLKPANVKLDPSGSAKVLDFGLAKAIEGDPATSRSGSVLSQSPTITGGMTAANVLLGTAAYMSPEQARGQVADRRADIWAFGAVLMEMLTGQRLFEGDTISDTLAAVLRHDPDFGSLPKDTPPRVRRLLRRCLQRDPKLRLRDIGEARILLDETLRGVPDEAAPASAAASRAFPWMPLAGGLLVGAILAFVVARATAPPRAEAPLRKFTLPADSSGAAYQWPVISPDGRFVAALLPDRIVIRDLSRFESHAYPLAAEGRALSWSPDSKNLVYASGSRLIRISAADGAQQVLSDTRGEFTGGSGTCWSSQGEIVFSRADTVGIMAISERGGDPRVVIPVDRKIEGDLHEPWVLPGGRGIVFASHTSTHGISELIVWSHGKRKKILELDGQTIFTPRYDPSGYLVFRRTPNTPGIWAVRFSLAKLEATGEPFLVVADAAFPSVSDDGTLCYQPGGAAGDSRLAWVSVADGKIEPIGSRDLRSDPTVALDPTGPRVVRPETEGNNQDLWMYDTVRGTRTRLTFAPADENLGGISPDGRRIVYTARDRSCSSYECWKVLRGFVSGGRVDTLALGILPTWTPDGRDILYTDLSPDFEHWGLMRVAADGSGAPVRLIPGNPRVISASLSPDGSLLAYVSMESEQYEVYLTRYPGIEGRWQVSTQGGQWPQWSPRGDRLYFCHTDGIYVVEVSGNDPPTLSPPVRLATRPPTPMGGFGIEYDFAMSRDGRQFVSSINPPNQAHTPGLAIVQNWVSEFREKR